jgi:hypothetical protein
MRDGLLVIGVTVLTLVLGALASDVLRLERPAQPDAGNHSRLQLKLVPGVTPDAGTVDCRCPGPTMAPSRVLAHPAGTAIGATVILGNDSDRRRDIMAMSFMIGRRHAAAALTLQPYQLSLGPEDSAAGGAR